jgi:hypothetical protein
MGLSTAPVVMVIAFSVTTSWLFYWGCGQITTRLDKIDRLATAVPKLEKNLTDQLGFLATELAATGNTIQLTNLHESMNVQWRFAKTWDVRNTPSHSNHLRLINYRICGNTSKQTQPQPSIQTSIDS